MDAKMPGGWPVTAVTFPVGQPPTIDTRFTYTVATIEVRRTDGVDAYSAAAAGVGLGAVPPPTFSLPLGSKRQVAMLQVVDTSLPFPVKSPQRYFYGVTASGAVLDRATNARAISVWRTGSVLTDRIAICGETYDEVLVGSQAPSGWALAGALHPTGFIAVYNGAGDVQWTHHFFDPTDDGSSNCAITDVSIRVDAEGNDVVTYCGIMTHGAPAGGELAPLLPFAPVSTCNGGAPTTSVFQWDGFVGRVTATGPGTSMRVFHSVVSGGDRQDGLFGLAEIDENRFAVVGSTEDLGGGTFPFTGQCGLLGPSVVGTVLVFDASATGGGGNLVLESSLPLGSPGPGIATVARDVHVGRTVATLLAPADDVLYVVGSTDDPGFVAGVFPFLVPPPPAGAALSGPTDGFVAAVWVDRLVPALFPLTFAYHGGEGDDGLTGVNGWSDFSEHVTVTGFTDDGAGGGDIDVATYFLNNSLNSPAVPGPFSGRPNGSNELIQIRRTQFGGPTSDFPAALGPVNASTVGLPFSTFGLGSEAGGGVGVGPEGRANVVGASATVGGGYPVVGGLAPDPILFFDAVRTEFDMLPPASGGGAARTDGTGFQGSGGAPPFPPAAPFTGGTTPFCAQSEFGWRNGVPPPAGGLPRMLIDFEGPLAAGATSAAILVSRPTPQPGSIAIGALQIGFPPAIPAAYITGVEFWLGTPVTALGFGTNEVFRLGLFTLPAGGGSVSAQLACLLVTPVTGAVAGCSSTWTASPALWFSW